MKNEVLCDEGIFKKAVGMGTTGASCISILIESKILVLRSINSFYATVKWEINTSVKNFKKGSQYGNYESIMYFNFDRKLGFSAKIN